MSILEQIILDKSQDKSQNPEKWLPGYQMAQITENICRNSGNQLVTFGNQAPKKVTECWVCNSSSFWKLKRGGDWICSTCHPPAVTEKEVTRVTAA
jgi:hypothetical protein